MKPTISVITPTWRRHELLLGRCMPSVQAQTYRWVEHVIVSDGPDPQLADLISAEEPAARPRKHAVRFEQLPAHVEPSSWGVHARLRGLEIAEGDIIAYLDDDNAYRPMACKRLAELFEDPLTDFAYGRVFIHAQGSAVGEDPPAYTQIDTSGMAHRRGVDTKFATWRTGEATIDWDIADRWMQAGARWAMCPDTIAEHY
jgi:glycosyltransferase involved in cell wall biosynthesis